MLFYIISFRLSSFPSGSEGKAFACNAGRPGFNPWVRKIPWGREWQPTPVFLPGESHGQATVHGVAKSQTRPHFHFHFRLSERCLKLTVYTVIVDSISLI